MNPWRHRRAESSTPCPFAVALGPNLKGNIMTSKNILASVLFASAALVAGSAMANDNPHTQPVNTPSAVSRAEVLADLEIYRESGLAAVEQSETYGYDNARRDAAKAKYAQLRSSPYYATLVKKFGGSAPATSVAGR
ncbi:hypothetical protein CDL60_28305 [Roseateles noduli]|nr:hypothetical protein CDL60_28305 [Roseateles noduli]